MQAPLIFIQPNELQKDFTVITLVYKRSQKPALFFNKVPWRIELYQLPCIKYDLLRSRLACMKLGVCGVGEAHNFVVIHDCLQPMRDCDERRVTAELRP